MPAGENLDLKQQLERMNEEYRQTMSAEILAVMQRAQAELIGSGILAGVLRAGDRAPDFTLPNAVERPYHLAAGLARGPVVVSFYRGAWCPYCNLQLRVYQQALPEIQARGASLVAISPQTPDHSQAMLLKNFLQYEVLSDVGNGVGRSFGLVYPVGAELRRLYQQWGVDLSLYNADDSWELPLPGTFVIDRDCTIRFAFVDADYTKRLQPSEILAVLESLSRS